MKRESEAQRERRLRKEHEDAIIEEAAEVYKEYDINAAWQHCKTKGLILSVGALQSRFGRKGIHNYKHGGGQPGWSAEHLAILGEYFPDDSVPPKWLKERLGRSWDTITIKAKALGLVRGLQTNTIMPKVFLPSLTISRPLLILADTHVPYQDQRWIERVSGLAVSWGVREVLIAGDGIDAQSYSKFEKFRRPDNVDEEEAWADFETWLLTVFDRLYWQMGNHEARIGNRKGWDMSLKNYIERNYVQNKENVEVLDSYTVIVNNLLHVEHPKMHGATTAQDLCSTHLKDVAVAHLHRSAIGRDRSGYFRGITIGASCDHSRMPYCTRITHSKWKMGQGALIVVPDNEDHLSYYNIEPDMDLERMRSLYSAGEWSGETTVGEELADFPGTGVEREAAGDAA